MRVTKIPDDDLQLGGLLLHNLQRINFHMRSLSFLFNDSDNFFLLFPTHVPLIFRPVTSQQTFSYCVNCVKGKPNLVHSLEHQSETRTKRTDLEPCNHSSEKDSLNWCKLDSHDSSLAPLSRQLFLFRQLDQDSRGFPVLLRHLIDKQHSSFHFKPLQTV